MGPNTEPGELTQDLDNQTPTDTLLAAIEDDDATTGEPGEHPEGENAAPAQETPADGKPLPEHIAKMTPEQLQQSYHHLQTKLGEQATEIQRLKEAGAAPKAPETPAQPAVDPAVAEYQAKLQRLQPRYEMLYARYVEQGYEEPQAKQYAWQDAESEDSLARANAQEMVRQSLGPYAALIESELVPATMTREIERTIGKDVPAADVLNVITETFNVPAAALNSLAPELRANLFKLGAQAARGKTPPPANVTAPAQEPTPTLTNNTARTNTAPKLTEAQTAQIKSLQRAFPTLSTKELAELL